MALLKLGILLLVALVVCAWAQDDEPFVNIEGMGPVRGTKNINTQWNNKRLYSFRGIPFGKSPSGPMRFKPSVRVDPWTEEFNATGLGKICVQTGSFKEAGRPEGFWDKLYSLGNNMTDDPNPNDPDPEDCLNLNVYTTTLKPDKPLPVMVFFHGGAFLDGSSYIYQPNFLLDHGDVILVVPHYRLGPIGFLCMHNDEIPGNAGMYDQILALEWVRDFISSFGGDPNQVTAFGESAGAASVSLLATSPLSKNLFQRIIAESGSAITEWAIDREPVRNARGIAGELGCDMSSDETITQCFMDKPAIDIIKAYKYGWKELEMKNGQTGFGGCSPVVQIKGDNPFITKMPIDYWRDPTFTTVPAMYGANKHEGTYVMGIVYEKYILANDLLTDIDFLKYDSVRVFLDLFLIKDPVYLLQDALEQEYVGIERMGNITAMIPGMIDFAGATFLKGPSFEQLKMHAKLAGNSYWYAFNYFNQTSLWEFVGSSEAPFGGGVTHANELLFLFNIPGMTIVMNRHEIKYAKAFSNVWFNYAVYGEIQPEDHIIEGVPADWTPYDAATDTYVRFDDEIQLLTNFPDEYTIAKDENFSLVPRE